MNELVRLFKAEPYSQVFDCDGIKVKLSILTREQFDNIALRFSAKNLEVQEVLLFRPILSYAIQEINGVKIKDFDEIKNLMASNPALSVNDALYQLLGQFDVDYINKLFSLYSKLTEEDQKRKEEVKKS